MDNFFFYMCETEKKFFHASKRFFILRKIFFFHVWRHAEKNVLLVSLASENIFFRVWKNAKYCSPWYMWNILWKNFYFLGWGSEKNLKTCFFFFFAQENMFFTLQPTFFFFLSSLKTYENFFYLWKHVKKKFSCDFWCMFFFHG